MMTGLLAVVILFGVLRLLVKVMVKRPKPSDVAPPNLIVEPMEPRRRNPDGDHPYESDPLL